MFGLRRFRKGGGSELPRAAQSALAGPERRLASPGLIFSHYFSCAFGWKRLHAFSSPSTASAVAVAVRAQYHPTVLRKCESCF